MENEKIPELLQKMLPLMKEHEELINELHTIAGRAKTIEDRVEVIGGDIKTIQAQMLQELAKKNPEGAREMAEKFNLPLNSEEKPREGITLSPKDEKKINVC